MTSDGLVIVMMEGPPGAGKTTLALGLTERLGRRAFYFGEHALFEVPEFAKVARAFRTKVYPDTAMMLDAYRSFFEAQRGNVDVLIFDWSCVGMIEDLPCAQHDRRSTTTQLPEVRADMDVLAEHAREVGSLVDYAVLLVLDVATSTAIARAYDERGEPWFVGFERIPELRSDGTFLDAAIRYWETCRPRDGDCVLGHVKGGWHVVHLDASAAPNEVADQALEVIKSRFEPR